MPSDVKTQVTDLIRRQLSAPFATLDDGTRFVEDLGADSLALVELTLAFEDAFDIDISDEDAERVRTVGEALRTVERCLRARRPE